MKQTCKLLMAIVLTGGLMASCKKDKHKDLAPGNGNNTINTSAPAGSASGSGGGSDMNYKIVATPLDTNNLVPVINWTAGYVRVTELHFEANMLNDDNKNSNKGKDNNNGNGGNSGSNNGKGPVTHVHYNANTVHQIDLFNPGPLGAVTIPYGTYDNIIVKLRVAPGGNAHALYLQGNATVAGLTVPVLVEVDETIDLMAKWMQPVTIDSNMNYLSNLTLSLGQLTAGIDASMLRGLVITNGTIIISANTNANIYQLLIKNMQAMLKVKVQ